MPVRLAEVKAEFFKALANPLRIRILDCLRDGAKAVSEISSRLEVGATNISQQLAILRTKNIVNGNKAGSNVYYTVRDARIFNLLDVAREILSQQLTEVRQTLRELRSEARL